MKFNKFIYATMAAALLAACSDKDVVADGPDTGTITVPEGGDGFVAVRINLPTQPVATPRAVNDDSNGSVNFDDGTPNEYAVKNGALLLFTGTEEKTAVFKSIYALNLDPWYDDADKDNITTSSLVSVKILNPAGSGDKIYGLVALNYTGVMSIGEGNTLTIDGTTFTGDFKAFVNTVSQKPFYTGSGSGATDFFMINAPVSTVNQNNATAPTDKNVSTLVDITGGVKATRAEAESNPAGSFFVERAVAKATVSCSATNLADKIIDNNGNEITFTVKNVEWKLNATNTKSYIVRNMYPADGQKQFIGYKNPVNGGYRMVGNTKIGTTIIQSEVDLYRTYWCYDPNYNTFTTGDLLYQENEATGFVKAVNTNPLYCYENTFNIDHQDHQYTTQVLLKVEFELTKNGTALTKFYTINERQNVIYATQDEATLYSVGQIIQDSRVAAAIATAIAGTGKTVTITEDNWKQYMTITFARNDKGLIAVTDIDFVESAFTSLTNSDGTVTGKKPVFGEGEKAALIKAVNNNYRIAEYDDNVAYYSVRIKHFAGDSYNDTKDLAPWSAEYVPVGSSSYDWNAYTGTPKDGDAESMWLGRYGMVRNNWYDINVTSIKKLGKPSIEGLEVPSDENHDDEVEQWIAFRVNILSWAKRQQNVEV